MGSFGGAKSIGLLTSVILLINNITGPGVPSLPNTFVEAGWLPPVACLLAVWFMTTLSAAMFCEAMERMPGNDGFHGRAEYSTVVGYYFGRRWYFAAQVGLNGALQSLNIISVVQSAQVMDVAIQSAALTRVAGRFSFTHEGTVVTKPKLKRIVPSTPATEPVAPSWLTAGSGAGTWSPDQRAERAAVSHVSQQPTVRMKAIRWITMLSSRFHRPHGIAIAAVSTYPSVTTM